MGKVNFKRSTAESFQKVLRQRINKYFDENQISMKGDWRLYSKAIILFTALIAVYIGIVTSTSWEGLRNNYLLLAPIIAGIGFNVMHDASHGSFSPNSTVNKLLAFVAGDIVGGICTYIWNKKHNIGHHSHTNIENHDDDIAQQPFFKMSPYQKHYFIHRAQAFYAIPFYSLLSLQWSLINDLWRAVITGKLLGNPLKMEMKDYLLLALGKILHFGIFIIIPGWITGAWGDVCMAYIFMHLLIGVIIAIVFQMAHVVEKTSFHVPPSMDEWMLHQLDTTANFAMKSKIITWYTGGLNFQIEHHLFSQISHVHYPAISKIVQDTCVEFNVTYNAFTTFAQAIRSHFRHLHKMGNTVEIAA